MSSILLTSLTITFLATSSALRATSTFRAGEGYDLSSEAEAASDNNATRTELCCAFSVKLGKLDCTKDDAWNCASGSRCCKSGTERWDTWKAKKLCKAVHEGQKYFLSAVTENAWFGPTWSLTTSCRCEGGKGHYAGKAVVRRGKDGAISCGSEGPVPGCKQGSKWTSSCACILAPMTCVANSNSSRWGGARGWGATLLFHPEVKTKGMLYNCGWNKDTKTAARYMEALKEDRYVDEMAEPAQKTIGSEGEESGKGWQFKEKYGGQSLAASGFCGAAPSEDDVKETEDVVASMLQKTSSADVEVDDAPDDDLTTNYDDKPRRPNDDYHETYSGNPFTTGQGPDH